MNQLPAEDDVDGGLFRQDDARQGVVVLVQTHEAADIGVGLVHDSLQCGLNDGPGVRNVGDLGHEGVKHRQLIGLKRGVEAAVGQMLRGRHGGHGVVVENVEFEPRLGDVELQAVAKHRGFLHGHRANPGAVEGVVIRQKPLPALELNVDVQAGGAFILKDDGVVTAAAYGDGPRGVHLVDCRRAFAFDDGQLRAHAAP